MTWQPLTCSNGPHELPQRVNEEWAAQPPESTQNEDQQCEQ